MSGSSKTRWLVAAGLPAAMILSLGATAVQAPASAAPVVVAAGGSQPVAPTIVGLGDSYMSGEGVMLANRNYPGGSESGDWSEWQTGQGALGGTLSSPVQTNNAIANTWLSVFGDANGYPTTGGKETISFCDRSYAAAMHIERGWTSKNLACSGATQNSQNVVAVGTICDEQHWKPGIDFFSGTVRTKRSGFLCSGKYDFTQAGQGQALMLQNLAVGDKSIEVVALSIGGNDFGFASIASECIKGFALGSGPCEKKISVQKMVSDGEVTAKAHVKTAVENVAKAMKTAGYGQKDWKLVYQLPPRPVSNAANTKWNDRNYDRINYGGCGLYDSTLNWIADPVSNADGGTHGVYARLAASMRQGLVSAKAALGDTQVTILENGEAFAGHRLCQDGTLGATRYAKGQAGKEPTWQDNNGKKTEWITPVVLTEQATGNVYQASMPLHPNYWGQRALSDCMDLATPVKGAVQMSCTQNGDGWDPIEHRPNMQLSNKQALWVVAVGQPNIQGEPHVGETLAANVDNDFEPAGASFSYAYQWQANGGDIAGATNRTYVPSAGDLGKQVTVTVTASLPGVDPASATSLPVTISDLDNTVAPSVSGSPTVGATLTVDPGEYVPTPDSFTYQWLSEGQPIAGATAGTYVPTAEELGRRISVQVVASKATYLPMTLFTAETAAVGEGTLAVTGKPTITGQPVAGATLQADASGVTFTPTPHAISYQWYRDGQPIPNADQATYEPGDADPGKRLTVSVFGHLAGYTDAESAQSDPTAPVQKGVIKVLKVPRVEYWDAARGSLSPIPDARARYGKVLEPELVGVFSEWPNDPDVVWYRESPAANSAAGQPDKIATGRTYSPKPSDIGFEVFATVTTTNEGFQEATATTDSVTVIKGKRQATAPVIVGKAKVGKKLSAKKARFVPSAEAKYQWLRKGKKIKGATKRTYVPVRSDAGKKLRVQATTKATSTYEASSVKSKATKPVKKSKKAKKGKFGTVEGSG